jgi:hypothetical protein
MTTTVVSRIGTASNNNGIDSEIVLLCVVGSGRYIYVSTSEANSCRALVTVNSGSYGTFIAMTLSIRSAFFLPARMSFKKSRVTLWTGGRKRWPNKKVKIIEEWEAKLEKLTVLDQIPMQVLLRGEF